MQAVKMYFTIAYFIYVITSQPMPEHTHGTTTTDEPWSVAPLECTDKCDAFGVRVTDYIRQNDEICITYQVQRFFDSSAGDACDKPAKYIILGICNDDSIEIDTTDLNGLLRNCTIYKNHKHIHHHYHNHNHSHSHDHPPHNHSHTHPPHPPHPPHNTTNRTRGGKGKGKGAKGSDRGKCYAVDADDYTGILVKVKPGDKTEFEICLQDVFMEDIEVSDNVKFRRGYEKYVCNDDWIQGLPCVDSNEFTHGSYAYSGLNYGIYREIDHMMEHKSVSGSVNVDNDVMHTQSDGVKFGVLVTCIILGSLCVIGVFGYVKISKRSLRESKGEAVKISDESETDETEEGMEGKEMNNGRKLFGKTAYEPVVYEDEYEMDNIN